MAISHPSIPAQYAVILVDLARQHGVDAPAVLAGTHLSAAGLATGITNMGARVSEEDFGRIVGNAYRLTGDRALGLHLGRRLNLSAHATMGQAFMTCENLEQVLGFFLKYYEILAPGLELNYARRDNRFWITTTASDDLPIEFSLELFFAALVSSLKMLLAVSGIPFRLELPYPAPGYAREYRDLFGDDVHFGRDCARISFTEEWLHTPLPSSNPALLALYEQECRRLLADLRDSATVAERTLRLLRKLEGHYPQMPQVAEMFNISPRTYRRRLAREQVSFQQLLDQVRAEQATQYLRTTRLPLASIAFMVGFNDVSNFRRAFTRWTGRSPREVRQVLPPFPGQKAEQKAEQHAKQRAEQRTEQEAERDA